MPTKLARQPMLSVWLIVLTACAFLVSGRTQETGDQETGDAVEAGKTVTLEYTVTYEEGSVAESNIATDPIEYVHGEGQIFPRLEEALLGMNVGDEKSVTLEPEDAYGPSDPSAYQEVPTEQVPEDARNVGTQLAVAGIAWPVLVTEVRPDSIVLDLNHPFAGKTLTFVVRILAIS